ncbi:MAG: alkaline phosphatase [Planctomycetota bacterium]|jgi:alkaline phosphatase
MKKRTSLVLVLVLGLAIGLVSTAQAEPKYVIFLIGDGMGFEQVKAGGMYANGQAGTLSFELFPYNGELTTYSADSAVTDSAAAGTALATGVKVNNYVISMAYPGDGSELETLLEYYKARGKSTGLVTTCLWFDATPAVFGAHESSRYNYEGIVIDYLYQTRPNVVLGGLYDEAVAAASASMGYTVVTDRAAMQALDTETQTMVFGQFGIDNLPYEYDGLGSLPHLSEMTATALSILDNEPNGFFLMVEGGRIDHACHDNDLQRAVLETVEFDNTVQVAIDWAAGRTDTLILVCADHETGGLTVLANNGAGVLPRVNWGTGTNTAANVPVYAWGVNAEMISGVMDNTDMFRVVTGDPQAWNPDPAVRAAHLETWVTLSWNMGAGVVSNDVYFGENFDDVNSGTGGTFRVNQTETSFTVGLAGFPYPDGLVPDTTYYWRIDEVNDTEPNSPCKGDVWRFNVLSLPGLVGWWKLDETEGAIAYDSTGNNDGIVTGEPLWQPTAGQIDGALQFDGIDDYISTSFILDPADAVFSVFAWIKGTTPGQVIISQTGGANWLLADPQAGALMTELKSSGRSGTPLYSQTVITDGDWHRIGLVWDGSNRMLYVDDVQAAKDAQAGFEATYGGLRLGAGKNLEPGSFFSGLIDDVRIYNRAITEFATQPNPPDGTQYVDTGVTLSWTPGLKAMTHDVYFGTSSPPVFIGNQEATTYYPGPLEPGTTYYWQIAEVEADGTMKHTGDVWSFTTVPGYATQPDPANNAVGVALDTTLSWLPGPTAATHYVYFGTSSPPPFIGNQAANSYDPGPLEFGTTYYWQIDEVEADGTTVHTGDIWSFTPLFDVTVPGDTVRGVPDDGDWPSNEAPPLAIDDDTGTKYLHLKGDEGPSGFRVTASASQSVVTALTFTTANDFAGRDPVAFELSGSNESIDGPYTLIASGDIVDFAQAAEWPRFTKNETPISFDNEVAYDHYQVLFTAIRGGSGQWINSMQIAEVELLGITRTRNAWVPSPADGATEVPITPTLSWKPGTTAASHDVYFGDSSPPAFVGNQTEVSYDPGSLEFDTTYYWQIAEVEADGTTIHTGDVWSFTTTATTGVRKGAYLIYPGDNTQMTVLWQLDATHDCTLEWGTDTNYGSSATSSEYGSDHQHQYTITSLAPGAKYYYRVQVEAGYLTGSFLAAPAADAENVKLLAYGDTRTNPDIHDAVNAEMIATYTSDPAYQTFTMLTGDWVANGDNESHWTNQFFNRSQQNTMEMQANLPINGCIGNHERSGTVFEKYWPYPYESGGRYWSFDYGPAHIVVLDQFTTSYAPGSPQYMWLQNDLANATAPWKFIQLHAPGWTAGGHGNNSAVQNDIQPLCETYGVAAVFCGHNHYYARAMVNGVAHITTGGGGAPLYQPEDGHPNIVAYERSNHFCKIDIQGRQLTFEAVRLDGTVIDTFTMSH